jgi:ornithine lipid ester-linked acyl 2-hydroxylase
MERMLFYSKDSAEYAQLLESNTDVIREELLNVIQLEASSRPLSSEWLAAHPNYVHGKLEVSWKTFEFVFFGIEKRSNIAQCPKTYAILEQVPGLITAQFSVMLPKTHIMPHKGYSRMVLRNHLGLVIPPNNQCGIKIEDETYYWKEGEMVVFDDSYLHEAWNNSDELRAVLMFDVAHPDGPYSADEICRYKMERVDDPFLLAIANKETWMRWFNQGYFDAQGMY